jgi:membrane associated rhomboid family serine protease
MAKPHNIVVRQHHQHIDVVYIILTLTFNNHQKSQLFPLLVSFLSYYTEHRMKPLQQRRRASGDPEESQMSPTNSNSSPRRSLSPRDPSGKRVTQQGAKLIVDEVASLTTAAEAAAAKRKAAAATAAAARRGTKSPPTSPPASPTERRVTSADTLDGLIQQVDLRGEDKYRSAVAAVLTPNDDTVVASQPSSATGTQMTLTSEYDDDDDDDEYEEEEEDDDVDYYGDMNDEVRITMDQVRSLSPNCIPSPNASSAMSAPSSPPHLTMLPPFLNKHHQKAKKQRAAAAAAAAAAAKTPSSTSHRATTSSSTTTPRGYVQNLISRTPHTPQGGATPSASSHVQKSSHPRPSTNTSSRELQPSSLPMVQRTETLNTLDSNATNDVYHIFSDDDETDYWKTKQKVPYCTLILTALQVLVLMLQLTLCGVAPLSINPMVGPFPDAFSEWGGKNPYLMMVQQQYWRFVTPAALHVGVLHLLLNAYCQLETCAYLEREWASLRWCIIYICSEVGCILVSSVNQPDTFAVGSTGAIMGLLGAKLAQATSHMVFDIQKTEYEIRLEQMSGIMCSLAMLSLLSFVTYIDWSANAGGLVTGFLLGMMLFCKPIDDVPSRVVWCLMGLMGLVMGGYVFGRMLFEQQDMLDAELADPCNYFRRLFPEGYDCECWWGA